MQKANGKTPVSYLQEQLISRQMCPVYELVYNGVGMQNPKFTFKVQVGSFSEEGTGKNKQKAKHKAAEKMLKTLNLIDYEIKEEEEEDDDDLEDCMDPVKSNHIGILKTYCQTHSYPDPIYNEEESSGPPHCKIFKIACLVSHIHQDGIATTKKAAKHLAAKKMLEQLKNCVKEVDFSPEIILVQKAEIDAEETLEKCKIAKLTVTSPVQNFLAFYRDHHKAYQDLHEESPTLSKLINGHVAVSNDNCEQLARDIAEELNVKLSMCTDLCTKDDKSLVLVSMDLTPSIAELGFSCQNAIFNLLKTLLILSK